MTMYAKQNKKKKTEDIFTMSIHYTRFCHAFFFNSQTSLLDSP